MFYGKATLLLWLLIASCDSANILGIATYDGNSHWLVMQSIFKSLAEAGHHVTVVTPYSKTAANVTLIDVSKYLPLRTNSFSFTDIKREYDHPFLTLNVLPGLSLGQCDKAHALPQVRQLLNGDHKFDVVISEIFGADCDAVFAHLLKVPLISVVTSTMLPWANYRVGNPENPAYVSNVLLPYAGVMSFNQRFINTLYYIYTATIDKYNNFLVTALNRKHFGNGIPPAEEIHRRTALVFVNSHVSIDAPRPFVPNVVEIGGIHLPPVKPLPKDLAEFMDNSRKGVIYFSLGSIIRAASLPNETINAFKQAFAELDLNVLWKFEDESLDVPSNVIVRKWFPQRDLLAHPNMKLAIVHGGLMGIYELVDVGIPAIGLPIFFDQQRNIANLASKGSVIGLEFHKLNKDYFLSHIRKILGDESYRIRAKQLSKIFHDRLVTPSQSVVYWTEYVIRHHGADHLRSTAADLSWYQYLLVDVFLSIIGALYLSLFISRKIMRTLTGACFVTQKKSLKNGIHYKTS